MAQTLKGSPKCEPKRQAQKLCTDLIQSNQKLKHRVLFARAKAKTNEFPAPDGPPQTSEAHIVKKNSTDFNSSFDRARAPGPQLLHRPWLLSCILPKGHGLHTVSLTMKPASLKAKNVPGLGRDLSTGSVPYLEVISWDVFRGTFLRLMHAHYLVKIPSKLK